MSGGERVRIPRLTSRSGWLWLGLTVVGVVGVLGFVAVTMPENRLAVAVVLPLFLLASATLLTVRTWVDTGEGTVGRSVLGLRRRPVALAAGSVRLVNNRGGTLHLAVAGDGPTAHVPVLALTDHVRRSQSPEVLRLLADQVEQWSPASTRTVAGLRRQADAIEGGTPPEASPLAAMVTRSVTGAAKAGGSGGLLP